ncbi:hypothetical protein KAFR_0H03350 [Kazachstania africana CBS 2517]|uniref:Myb-like domain-containing protein n=1 Tax=Kazachstania africana (strain ATCC 22294 / BCRC 22015 / CBS 2517 / CECT 1963 / NBRC 1671 / NRRL Y-8276) TaxID=1071382 RepID=H2AZI9_KAZAF|nr:hypothetical protein KAFR_0H03350 [Kazachstania africana CBS 2517]CCF59745.1 hypothetical protein KAFR_0H03350 [Kazachstania africana CBS 2517]
MSSVVNKSGTRFAPKVRQRRTATASPVPLLTQRLPAKTNVIEDKPSDVEKSNSDREDDMHDREDRALVRGNEEDAKVSISMDVSPVEKPSTLSRDELFTFLDTSTQRSKPHVVQARSSRLNSLTHHLLGTIDAKPVFKPSYNEMTVPPTRRLSTISNGNRNPNTLPRRIRINSLLDNASPNDDTLRSIKKRRKSSASRRKSTSTHRLSVVSKIKRDPALDTDGIYDRNGNVHDPFKIRSIKDLPKKIEEKDSSRYTIDESIFTMADLCKPTLPIGEISDNFERANQATRSKLEKRKKRRELRQKAREDFKSLQALNKEEDERLKQERKEAAEKFLNRDVPEYQETPTQGIKLKLNPDGQINVDEESTVVDRHKNASLENAHKEKVDENPFENLYNYGTYGKGSYTDPWKTEELIKFYKALSMWGTDFNVISQLFPYRTRRQIKSKFISEEKKHPVMVELALRSKLPPDFVQYCTDIKKEIGTVDDFNKKIEELQINHENNLKELERAKENAKLEDIKTQNELENSPINKKSAGGLMSNDLKNYRKSEVVLGTIDDIKRQREETAKKEEDDENDGDVSTAAE